VNRKLDKNKRIQTSNWETENLSKEQIVYAADDALAALHVYACIEKFQPNLEHLTKVHTNADYKFKSNKQQKSTQRDTSPKINQNRPETLKCVEVYLREGPLYRRHPNSFKHKAKWYIRKGLAKVIEDSETKFVVQFTFPADELEEYKHGLRPMPKATDENKYSCQGDVTFNTTENSNQCVVCATTDALIRRILVPREYRKHFPLAVHAKRDVVLLCLNCHSKNNEFDQIKRLELAATYAAPVGGNIGDKGSLERKNARSAGNALLRNGHKMPDKRRAELEQVVVNYFDQKFSMDLAKNAADLPLKIAQETDEQHGKRVVEILTEEGGEEKLHAFQMEWRQHFIKNMNPKFMPDDWHDWKENWIKFNKEENGVIVPEVVKPKVKYHKFTTRT